MGCAASSSRDDIEVVVRRIVETRRLRQLERRVGWADALDVGERESRTVGNLRISVRRLEGAVRPIEQPEVVVVGGPLEAIEEER